MIGATSAVKINNNFAVGASGEEDLTSELRELKKRHEESAFIQLDSQVNSFARAAAKSGSGVRARWIELPDCQQMVNWDSGDDTFQAKYGEVIPLKADLSNAIIATCKGPHVAQNSPVPVLNPLAGIPTPVEKSQIYDPVWKTNTVIPDGEHQVQQLQHGHVDMSEQTIGPRGDFYMKWKY